MLDLYANVFANGTVFITPPSVITIRCHVDVNEYPFDEKNCTMKFAR